MTRWITPRSLTFATPTFCHGPIALGVLIVGLLSACAPSDTSGPETTGQAASAEARSQTSSNPAGWTRLPAPELPDRPLQAAFLVVDGVFNTELVAPLDIFDHSVFEDSVSEDSVSESSISESSGSDGSPGAAGIEVFTVSPDGQPITTYEGLVIQPDHSFETAPPADILVVASADNSRGSDLENTRMIEWVRQTGEDAQFVLSLCWGAFVLAEAGLLDGLNATTFPSDLDDFATRFPEITVQRDYSFVHDGKALTSHGGVKSFDVAMYLIDHLYGEAAAQRIGGGLLIDWPPAPDRVPMWVEPPGE